MATTNIRLDKPTVGGDDNAWGTKLNTDLDLIDAAISGMTTVNTTGGTTTLTALDGAADQARAAILKITGTLVSNATLVIPAVTKCYTVWNATSGAFTVTVKVSGQTGVDVAQGYVADVFCDGTTTRIRNNDAAAVGFSTASKTETLTNKTLGGVLNANSNAITNLPTPSQSDTLNAANVQYVETRITAAVGGEFNPTFTDSVTVFIDYTTGDKYSFGADFYIQNAFTGTGIGYKSAAQYGEFTSGTMFETLHFTAFEQSATAGGVIPNQTGFLADDSLVSATNNYGFRAEIPSGSNRWNFYSNGTAQNAFRGNTRFGGVTAPTCPVDVTGAVKATGGIDKLTTATGAVDVGASAAPQAGYVLKATGATTATWQAESASNAIEQGEHEFFLGAGAFTPTKTNGATADFYQDATNTAKIPVIKYGASADSYSIAVVKLPKSWNAGSMRFRAVWTTSTAGGDVDWTFQVNAGVDGDSIDAAFSTTAGYIQTVTDATLATPTGKRHIADKSAAVSINGNVGDETFVTIRVGRSVADDLTGDALLLGVTGYYTINASTDA